ncbi:DUF2339 domain-containing protein [bacterium]|nr:DUF2339 domain-containing protein [candidate division CSSED10-310 bacterium]
MSNVIMAVVLGLLLFIIGALIVIIISVFDFAGRQRRFSSRIDWIQEDLTSIKRLLSMMREDLEKQKIPHVEPEMTEPEMPVYEEPVTEELAEREEIPVTPEKSMGFRPAYEPEETGTPVEEHVAEPEVRQSKLVESVKDIMAKMWSWILVGEEHRPKNVTVEYAIASTWLLRFGIIAIVMCVAYFLKWSIDRNLLGPVARIAMSMVAGVIMLAGGIRLIGKKYHVMGQGFLGGGLLTLYFSAYAMGPMYNLVSIPLAFGLMILITVCAGIVSVRTDSLLTAILGLAGGFAAPVMLNVPGMTFWMLFAYMLALNGGILFVAYNKQWRLLNYLGFLATYTVFYLALWGSYSISDFTVTIVFLTLFFVIHSAIVYLYKVVRRETSTILEIIYLVANASIYAGNAYFLIKQAHGQIYCAIMAAGLGLFFISHVIVFLQKKLVDRNLLTTLIALAGLFTIWTLPLLFAKGTLTIALALMAFMLLWLGRKLHSNFIENVSHLVYLIVFVRLLSFDLNRSFFHLPESADRFADYIKQMAPRLWTYSVSIATVIGGFFVQKRRDETRTTLAGITKGNDIPQLVPCNTVNQVFYWFSLVMIFVLLQLEFNLMFRHLEPLRMPVLTLIWCGMAGYFLWKYITDETKQWVWIVATGACVAGAILKTIFVDLVYWKLSLNFVYNHTYSFLNASMRLLDFGAVVSVMILAWYFLLSGQQFKHTAPVFGYAGLGLFFLYSTFEINSLLFWRLPDFQQGGLSVLWAVFAIGLISGGIWKSLKTFRYAGLVLFAIVALKISLVDLAKMAMIYRVIAFMVVGVMLLLGSFAYIYSNKKFRKDHNQANKNSIEQDASQGG